MSLPYTVEWRADGGEWSQAATFAAEVDALTFAEGLAKRPVTGAVMVMYRKAVIYRPDVYAAQQAGRLARAGVRS